MTLKAKANDTSTLGVQHAPPSELPDAVQDLVVRKLAQQRMMHEKLLGDVKQTAYSKLRLELSAHIQAGKLGMALISVPMDVYGDIVAAVTDATQLWPGIVWETIKGILDNTQVKLLDGKEITALIDKFTWTVDQHPFTLKGADVDGFRENVYLELRRIGVLRDDLSAELNQQLALFALRAECGILNAARQAREGVDIALSERLAVQRLTPASVATDVHKPVHIRREAGKLATAARHEAWRKEYRALKAKNPDEKLKWFSWQISKMKIGQGRSPGTIYRILVKKLPVALPNGAAKN